LALTPAQHADSSTSPSTRRWKARSAPKAKRPKPTSAWPSLANTRNTDRSAVRTKCDWCARRNLPPLPARSHDVATFLSAERRRGMTPNTTLCRSAIRYLHRAAACPVPTTHLRLANRRRHKAQCRSQRASSLEKDRLRRRYHPTTADPHRR